MKILLEDTIPFGSDYLNDLAEVTTYAWQSLQPEMLRDIDILALRSTTKVTPQLLQYANKLKFVTTATAGTNHLDKAFLDKAGITHSSAAGCNAVAVAEYVLSVLLHAHKSKKISLANVTVGIVGAGNVGSALSAILKTLNISYKLCDPPLAKSGDSRDFVSMDEIAQCDVISLHVPFIKSGPYATEALIDNAFLEQLNANQLLINACRGEVIDENALVTKLNGNNAPTVVLDVFDNEPNINTALFEHAWFVTPHIAGHSVEGKVRGTQMIYEQICEVLGKPVEKRLGDFLSPTQPIKITLKQPQARSLSYDDLATIYLKVYDVAIDDAKTRETLLPKKGGSGKLSEADIGDRFAQLRKQYRIRRECSAYTLHTSQDVSTEIAQTLKQLSFTIKHSDKVLAQ
ncbi:4-phosphoerythronate dehydrogenase [Alteromonas sp. McT4-15]|uniref:4-phosphoerythronate dehydrogenase n=1 Tax=Alteromonas sp. McT4-15 TaxID=2881256 RepID=UPI001CF827FA|nr:4-phosphoerythronate dehydrogenase [Alteromonas sp. McT4-15]MCB4436766.1 4-phosphoerythronate dehydrogenase [Alteromonas sp. McT4-15]